MKKFYISIIFALFLLSLAPFAFSAQKSPLYIKKAEVYTRAASQGVAADVMVCNRVKTPLKFVLRAENVTIGTHYKRNFISKEVGCQVFNLKFKTPFSTAANGGDKLLFALTGIKSEEGKRYMDSDEYLYTAEEKDPAVAPCSDEKGKDGDYTFCVGDFFTHEPSGLRIKITAYDGKKVDLLVTGLRWGEVEKMSIYKEHSKKIVAGDERGSRIKITNIGYAQDEDVILLIETL